MRQVHHEVVQLALDTADHADGLAKINLRMTGRVRKRYEHLPAPQTLLPDIVPDDRDPASIAMLVAQPFEYPARRMTLLGRSRTIRFHNAVDDADKAIQLRTLHWLYPPITGRDRKPQHLVDSTPVDPEHSSRFPTAHPFHHHRMAHARILHPCPLKTESFTTEPRSNGLLRHHNDTASVAYFLTDVLTMT